MNYSRSRIVFPPVFSTKKIPDFFRGCVLLQIGYFLRKYSIVSLMENSKRAFTAIFTLKTICICICICYCDICILIFWEITWLFPNGKLQKSFYHNFRSRDHLHFLCAIFKCLPLTVCKAVLLNIQSTPKIESTLPSCLVLKASIMYEEIWFHVSSWALWIIPFSQFITIGYWKEFLYFHCCIFFVF